MILYSSESINLRNNFVNQRYGVTLRWGPRDWWKDHVIVQDLLPCSVLSLASWSMICNWSRLSSARGLCWNRHFARTRVLVELTSAYSRPSSLYIQVVSLRAEPISAPPEVSWPPSSYKCRIVMKEPSCIRERIACNCFRHLNQIAYPRSPREFNRVTIDL